MNINVTAIQPSTKPNRLADAIIELADTDGDSVRIFDLRVLQNRNGQKWVAMPSRSVSDGGRSFQFLPQVEFSRDLQRRIEDAVLTAYDAWKHANVNSEARS